MARYQPFNTIQYSNFYRIRFVSETELKPFQCVSKMASSISSKSRLSTSTTLNESLCCWVICGGVSRIEFDKRSYVLICTTFLLILFISLPICICFTVIRLSARTCVTLPHLLYLSNILCVFYSVYFSYALKSFSLAFHVFFKMISWMIDNIQCESKTTPWSFLRQIFQQWLGIYLPNFTILVPSQIHTKSSNFSGFC